MYQTEKTERIGCFDMLAAVKGIIRENTVVVEDDMTEYDGEEVIVTVLDYPNRKETSGEKKCARYGKSITVAIGSSSLYQYVPV